MLFFADFLFLGQLEGAPVADSPSEGLLRGDGPRSELDVRGLGGVDMRLTELFGRVVSSKAWSRGVEVDVFAVL